MLGIMFNTEKQKNVSRYPTEKITISKEDMLVLFAIINLSTL